MFIQLGCNSGRNRSGVQKSRMICDEEQNQARPGAGFERKFVLAGCIMLALLIVLGVVLYWVLF